MLELKQGVVENGVLVNVEHKGVPIPRQFSSPGLQPAHRFTEDLNSANTIVVYNLICLLCPGDEVIHRDSFGGLVDEAVESYDVLVAVLGEEFGQLSMNIQSPLGVGGTFRAANPVDLSIPSTVVPSVLTSRHAMEVELHAKSILACPLNAAKEITPGDARHIRVVVECLHCPIREWDPNMVQTCSSNGFEVILRDECTVVLFQQCSSFLWAQLLAQAVFVLQG